MLSWLLKNSWNYKENFPNEPPLVHFYRTSTVFGGCKSPPWKVDQTAAKGPGQTPVEPKGIWLRNLSGWSLATFQGWWWTCGNIHFHVQGHTIQKHSDRLSSLNVHMVFFVMTFALGGLPPGDHTVRLVKSLRGPSRGPSKRHSSDKVPAVLTHQKDAYCHLVLKRRSSSQDRVS